MNSSLRISPTVAGLRFVISIVCLISSVAVIVEIDIPGFAPAAVPSKDQPPLPVDADRIESCEIAAQPLEMIAGRHAQVLIGCRVVDHEAGLKIGWDVPRSNIFDVEGAQPLVPETQDHATGEELMYHSMVQNASLAIAEIIDRLLSPRVSTLPENSCSRRLRIAAWPERCGTGPSGGKGHSHGPSLHCQMTGARRRT